MEDFNKFKISWKRSATIPFPNVWNRFQVKRNDGTVYQIKIQEIHPDRFTEILEFIKTYFDRDEPLSKAVNVLKDKTSTVMKETFRRKILEKNISIMATFDNENEQPEILGVLLINVRVKDEPRLKIQAGEAWKKALDILKKVEENVDIYQEIGSDRYFDTIVVVASEYRGLDLCFRLLECLPEIGKSFGIPGTMSVCTNIQSQKIAERAGHILYNEIKFEDYKDENGKLIFPITDTKSVQCRIKKFTS